MIMSSLGRHLHHTWALLERPAKPGLAALTEALLTDWAADPQAVDIELILAELRLAKPDAHLDFSAQLGHLVWWEKARLAGSHLSLEADERSALGTAFEFGVLLLSTSADHPHLQEASLNDIHETWVRRQAGDDAARAAALREQLVLLVVLEGKGALAPDLYVVARRAPGENNESPPPIGVIPVRLHRALERANKGEIRRDVVLSRELGGLASLVARSADEHWRDELKPFDRKGYVDRYRRELRQTLETTIALLEDAAGRQAETPEALAELREAASVLLFRVYFVVALERRGLLYTKPVHAGKSLRGLVAAGEEAKDSPFLYLQDLTAAIRGGASPTRRRRQIPVAVKHASIFRNRPTDDFSPELKGWLDALDKATPKLAKDTKRLAAWDALLGKLEPLALGEVTRYEFEALETEPIGGGSAHVQRILGDVYEQILAMIPVRSGKGKSSRVQLTLKGKPRKGAGEDAEPTTAKELKALEKGAKSERKALGAHYTPESLVIEVVLAALEPVFAAAWTRAGENADRYQEELLGLRVLDPAMGSAHFLTVAALEIARELAWAELYQAPREPIWFEVWPEEYTEDYEHTPDPWNLVDPGDREELDRYAARRLQEVVEACCYGVDVKPLAVELGKLALWMLTMVERQARGAEVESDPPPLTFVDKNLRCGDSLRGADEEGVRWFLSEVYGIAGESQRELFSTEFNSLDDVMNCLLGLHQLLSRPAGAVTREAAAGLLKTAGGELGKPLSPESEEPQELRAQLYAVTQELEDTLRWTWDLAFLYDWYRRREGDLWEAIVGPEETVEETWVGLLGGTGKLKKKQQMLRERVRAMARDLRVFHWPLEFYDVFHRENRGFESAMTNPPFLGSQGQRAVLGADGVNYLKLQVGGVIDLTGAFILRLERLLGDKASMGLVAPNSVSQGKLRRLSIVPLVHGESGTFHIYRCSASRPWPGEASVHIATLHLVRGEQASRVAIRHILKSVDDDGNILSLIARPQESSISSFLDSGPEVEMAKLPGRKNLAFQGMIPRGDFDRPVDFIKQVPRRELGPVFLYLNNQDVQQQPQPLPPRVVIDFSDVLASADMENATASVQEQWLTKNFRFLYNELRSSVRQERLELPQTKGNAILRERWWLFEKPRPALRLAWTTEDTVIVIGAVGKIIAPVPIERVDHKNGLGVKPTHQLFVVPSSSHSVLGLLTSLLFETFVRRACSSLKSDLRFTPTEVFPYFPFPWPAPRFEGTPYRSPALNVPGAVERRLTPPSQALLDLRKDILLHPDRHGLTRAEVGGPTDLYNLFDSPRCENPSIQRLREAHHALELAILSEYDWQDLHGPWTFDRPWIDGTWRHVPPAETRRAYLERLAALNHEQAAADTSS
ncbi:hypothetical protein PPSIR1_05876 [Plesiocystis pacifica SIR-1]|uniref:site-specific DNA-methyltransferase (adenine-specific) n=2 Tax=Plesiocystis pacifica TaxID=191768 RepID=A6GIP4_9BACT|nr:hypothetical protein PPSIR1_05876 [Plesiocystis pacifica SIR-1]